MRYFDLHCDTPYECYRQKQPFLENTLAVSAKRGVYFEKWKQVFAIFIRDDHPTPYQLYQNILADFQEKLAACPPCVTPYFAVEGGAVIEDDLTRIAALKRDGVRFFTLTWNGQNRLAGGSLCEQGLTEFGREAIACLNREGICTDLSHLNDRSFYAAVSCAKYPVATHANCRAVCNVRRNLKDDQIRLIAEKEGLIGLCFYPPFLCGEVVDALFCNITHLCKLGLENYIAIGSDFDGGEMSEEVKTLSDIPPLYGKLSEMGIKESVLRKVFYENAHRYIKTFDKRANLG